MPTPDDAFVQTLSRLAADVAPTIDVDTSRVTSPGRRRRDRRRSVAAGTLGVAMIAGVGLAQVPVGVAEPTVSAHEKVAEVPDTSELAISTFDVATEDEASDVAATDDEPTGLPTALVVGLGALGVGALGAGTFFAVRSRRHTR